MRIIDISHPLRAGMPVWKGDQPFEPKWNARLADGATVNLGSVRMSLHTGTHADAPLHVADDVPSIDECSLSAYIGPAIVIEYPTKEAIPASVLDNVDVQKTPRVLFRTRTDPAPDFWEEEVGYLSTDLIRRLADEGAVLVGVDTPSVDHIDSKTLDTHHAQFGNGMMNLENLKLDHVAPGVYQLIAFPLRIEGMDASPVRAVLIENGSYF